MAEIYVSTDVEADGPIPGPHSMLSFGSAAFRADKTRVTTFSANLETLPDASGHPATMRWWKTQPRRVGRLQGERARSRAGDVRLPRVAEETAGTPRVRRLPRGRDEPFTTAELRLIPPETRVCCAKRSTAAGPSAWRR